MTSIKHLMLFKLKSKMKLTKYYFVPFFFI